MDVWSPATPFCPRCGTLLVFPDVGDVVCDACAYSCRMQGACGPVPRHPRRVASSHIHTSGRVGAAAGVGRRRVDPPLNLPQRHPRPNTPPTSPPHTSPPPPPLPSDMPSLTVVTRSHPKPEPEWLIEHRAAQALLAGGDAAAEAAAGADKRVKRAEVKEECPRCKNPIMQFYTMQLRSVRGGRPPTFPSTTTQPWEARRFDVSAAPPPLTHTSSSCPPPFPPLSPSLSYQADEGQTVFYECPSPTCGYKYSINT